MSKSGRKPWGRWLAVVAGVLLIGLFGGYGWLRNWLHSEDFRVMLEGEAGRALGVRAGFGPFKWEGTRVSTSEFTAEGEGVVREVSAQGLSLDVGLGKVRQRIVEIRDARISRLEVTVDPRRESPGAVEVVGEAATEPPPAARWYDRFVPREAELTGLEINQSVIRAELEAGTLGFEGTSWVIRPGAARMSYEARGTGGVVGTPWKRVPPLRLGEARMRYQDGRLFLTHADFRLYERGALTLSGEVGLGDGDYAFDGNLVDVDAGEVVPEDWKQRLQGRVASGFGVIDGPKGPVIDGDIDLSNGILTGLPVLEALGAYGDNQRFLRLTLSEARTSFLWEDGVLRLEDFVMASEGLMRIEGSLLVMKDDRLDGKFRLGLTPGTLSRIPGAETKVFMPGERGLLWTEVRISGTVDEPEEDLTSRLIMAAGMRMLEVLPETGEKVLKLTGRALSPETLREVTGEGGILRQGENLIEQGKSLIEGEGDPLEGAGGILREGSDLIDRGRGILGILGGEEPAEETVSPDDAGDAEEERK